MAITSRRKHLVRRRPVTASLAAGALALPLALPLAFALTFSALLIPRRFALAVQGGVAGSGRVHGRVERFGDLKWKCFWGV